MEVDESDGDENNGSLPENIHPDPETDDIDDDSQVMKHTYIV